jgi:hypothetical protein
MPRDYMWYADWKTLRPAQDSRQREVGPCQNTLCDGGALIVDGLGREDVGKTAEKNPAGWVQGM